MVKREFSRGDTSSRLRRSAASPVLSQENVGVRHAHNVSRRGWGGGGGGGEFILLNTKLPKFSTV